VTLRHRILASFRWLWVETALGALLRRVRDRLKASGDPALGAVAFGIAR